VTFIQSKIDIKQLLYIVNVLIDVHPLRTLCMFLVSTQFHKNSQIMRNVLHHFKAGDELYTLIHFLITKFYRALQIKKFAKILSYFSDFTVTHLFLLHQTSYLFFICKNLKPLPHFHHSQKYPINPNFSICNKFPLKPEHEPILTSTNFHKQQSHHLSHSHSDSENRVGAFSTVPHHLFLNRNISCVHYPPTLT
jgi:hypothetical protein